MSDITQQILDLTTDLSEEDMADLIDRVLFLRSYLKQDTAIKSEAYYIWLCSQMGTNINTAMKETLRRTKK